MATRSNVGYKKEDGTYRYIYCHWDGYPSGNGKILREHYQDPAKIIRLVENGDLSSLSIECDGAPGHTFNHPVDGQTVYYGRDRHEEDCEAKSTDDRNDIYQNEYAYVFEDGQWFCIGHMSDEWMPLDKAIFLSENC